VLDIAGSGAADLQPIAAFSGLRELDISDNRDVTSLEPLKGLQALETLHFSNCNVSDVEVLTALPKLSTIMVHGNPAKNIKVLAKVPALTNLWLTADEIGWNEGLQDSWIWTCWASRRTNEPWIFDVVVLHYSTHVPGFQAQFAGIDGSGESRVLLLSRSDIPNQFYRLQISADGSAILGGRGDWFPAGHITGHWTSSIRYG
jgi:Leucine-rich repeat (LRR) protein